MQAISIKYLAPTNTKGGRLKASCSAGSIIIQYSHELGHEAHKAAALALCEKLGWVAPHYNELVGGSLVGGSEVFVFLPKGTTLIATGSAIAKKLKGETA